MIKSPKEKKPKWQLDYEKTLKAIGANVKEMYSESLRKRIRQVLKEHPEFDKKG